MNKRADPHPPENKDEAGRKPKRAMSPFLIWKEGGGQNVPSTLFKIVLEGLLSVMLAQSSVNSVLKDEN